MQIDSIGTGTPSAWPLPSADRVLELVFVGVLITGALGLLAALIGVFEPPQIWLLGLLLTGAYERRTRSRQLFGQAAMRWLHVALLIVVTLFFRLPAFHYVLGGQDEGVYVNVASHIVQTGGVRVSDGVVGRLLGTPAFSQYLASNRLSGQVYLSGIYTSPGSTSGLEFQFYHLFPVWMALVAGVFGMTAGVYALTLFALLSVLFAYRLVLTLTGQHRAALLAAMLLALSPLHAFFSKFPVTEVLTLACSLAGFGYLAGYWKAAPEQRRLRMLVLALAAFASLFLMRISGFMYMPFFLALACLSALRDTDTARKWAVQAWVLAVVLAYAASVIYGFVWSHSYASDIYLGGVFGPAWRGRIAAIWALGLLCWVACLWSARVPARRERLGGSLISPVCFLVGLCVLTSLLIVVLRVHWLGWTRHYASDAWLSDQWGLSGSHWTALKATSFAQLAVYMGPLLLIAGLVLLCRPRRDPAIEFMRLVTAGFTVYVLVLQWVVPYGPYYARYLLSEALPYLVLFVVCVWASLNAGHARRLLGAVLALSLVYAGVVSAGQIGKQENDGLYASLKELVSHVDKSDVILLDSMDAGLPDTNEIKTPLLYTFGKQVVTVSDTDLADTAYLATIGQQFDDMYLITPTPSAPPGFEQEDSVRVKVWAFKRGYGPPHKMFLREDMRLYLFRRMRPLLPMGTAEVFQPHSEWNSWLDKGWSNPESWGVWAVGQDASLVIDTGELPPSKTGIRLHFKLQAFVSPRHPHQRARIEVDGKSMQPIDIDYPSTQAAFDVAVSPQDLQFRRKLVVHFNLPDAVSPQSLNLGADTRVLSLGLISVEAQPLPAKADTRPEPGTLGKAASRISPYREVLQSLRHPWPRPG